MESLLHFEVLRPLPSFPRPTALGFETRDTPAYHWEGRSRGGPCHCIFQYTLAGHGGFRDAAGDHDVGPGEGFLCESHDPATAYSYPAESHGQPWRFLYLAFVGPTAHDLVRDLIRRHGAIYRLPADKGVVKRLRGFRAETPGGVCPLTPAAGAGLVLELLCALAASREGEGPETAEDRLVRRAKAEIEQGLEAGRLNVAALSARLRVSREHLSRVFRLRTGMTPYQYILRRQMLLACHWLADDRASVKEIAARLGFAGAANFVRTFHRLLGQPPARFRVSGSIPHLL
ncbi:MAG: AraC family transcriptional regulator [Lentisphaeria bacterium]|jgi:AraC-like DNA-binding protein